MEPLEEVLADQLHDTKVHELKLAMTAGQFDIKNAKLKEKLDEVLAVPEHDSNLQRLELEIVTGEVNR